MSLSFHNLIPKSDIPINVDIIWKLASQRLQSPEKQNLGEKKSQKACKKETKPGGRPGAQGCQAARASLLATAHCSAREHTQKHPDHSSPADALWSTHRSRRGQGHCVLKNTFIGTGKANGVWGEDSPPMWLPENTIRKQHSTLY